MRFSLAVALTLFAVSATPSLAFFAHDQYDARDLDAALYSRAYHDSEGSARMTGAVTRNHGREDILGSAPRSLEDFGLYAREKDARKPRPFPPKKPTRTYSVVFPENFRVPKRRSVRWV